MKKEEEFIISSEELKKNQERILKLEEEANELRAEAKRILEETKKENQVNIIVACLAGIIIIILLALIFNTGTQAVEDCVAAGNSTNFCKTELWK